MLSGPIGWGIALVAGTGAAIWAAAPDADKTTAFILALHDYKAKRAEEIAKKIQDLGGEVAAIEGYVSLDTHSADGVTDQ